MAVVSLQIQPGEAAGDRLPSESGKPSASAGHGFPGMTISRGQLQNSGNLPLEGCFFAQIGSISATVGGGGYDEVQGGHRLHSG